MNLIRKNKTYLYLLAAFLLLFAVQTLTGIGCPIRFLFGISCAGCGMTRAVLQVLHGRVTDAFTYHPLWPLTFIWIIGYPVYRNKTLKQRKTAVCITVILFLTVYILRMFSPTDTIVEWQPGSGFFARTFKLFY